MNGVDVSIIIVTYNSDFEKLKKTIKSVIFQKNVDFEVIICDDGSKIDFSAETDKFFKENHFTNYTIIRNPENLGTIKNIYSGLKIAKGEYVYTTSPGDFLYDENTIAEFLHFAKEKQAKICFGNYIKYNYENQNLTLYSDNYNPRCPERYTKGLPYSKVAFFLIEDNICGIAYFRKTEFFKNAIKCIKERAKYAEDGTTTAWGLMQDMNIVYFDRNISWYEYGTGISAEGKTEWGKKIKKDYDDVYEYLYSEYPESAELSVRKNQYIRFDFLIRYPIVAWRKNKLNKLPNRVVTITEQDKEKLLKILKG